MFANDDLVDISQSAGGDISRAGYDVVTAYEKTGLSHQSIQHHRRTDG